jgi:hypothetical protein
MSIDLRTAEVLHHVSLTADHAHHPDLLAEAMVRMKNRINEYSDRDGLRLVVAIVRPKQDAIADKPETAKPARAVYKPSVEAE